MAARAEFDLQVAYCDMRGAEAALDPGFGTDVKWDIPLLDGYSWRHVPNRGSGAESFLGLRNPGLWPLIRKGNFDAILCYVGYVRATFWIAYLAAKLSQTAFLFGTDAVTLTPQDGRKWRRWAKRLTWPLLFRLADQVIVPSSRTLELIRSLGIADDRITLTPYVVDNDWWFAESAQADREALRAPWGVSQDGAVILFCAKLQPWKRPRDLLQAFAKVNLPKTVLVFAGDGPLRGSLEAEAEALGVARRVRFLGFVNQSQLPGVYTAADLMVLPSEYEPFAVVVNEAMCCGCPVAVSDSVGAARDLVLPVHREFIFPCGDIEALAGILRQVPAERSKLIELGRAGRRRMESWSPRENIEATLDAVARAVARKNRRPVPHNP
jgi:glycosyltransferase involved in cell wall biosynthesis